MKLFGKILFIVCYPGLFLLLNCTRRTRVIVRHNNQLVLVRPLIGMGEYLLPGGGLHRGETPKQSAVRELREETGIVVCEADLNHLKDAVLKVRGISFTVAVFEARIDYLPTRYKRSIEIVEIKLMSQDEAQLYMHPAEADLIAKQ